MMRATTVDPVALLRTHFPALELRDVRVVEDGWDSLVLDLDGEWIVRFPRRPEVEQWVEREIALLPELAVTLPVAVPRFDLIARNGVVCVGYRKPAGSPARATSATARATTWRISCRRCTAFRSSALAPSAFHVLTRCAGASGSGASARISDAASSRCSTQARASRPKPFLRACKSSISCPC